ncbi:hypothetical protein CPJCM30710_19780 [Clostridium polyendosporum]|uniref:DUF2806 domain-containing protein n=1 Tax=Clostridium polyendosporum TaxID=69208 RepID=A0A919VGL9_9CLOT|nr:DUF2806 domain-containing protein [Clostridium polyendosporum]GIM29312.1 hypothetical protein CPJCM30710_19780 [Clostridium polyendosporum]
MDIKDLAGIGEPLKKLIEVVSLGFGKIYEPHAIKKNAEAKAIEIKTIAEALSIGNLSLEKISYEDGKLVMNTVNNNNENSNITERTIDRLISQQEKRQANIENIINNAANELKEAEFVSSEKIDEDWISRFFSISEDITSEEMQLIWGKILAGEVKKPNSYSLRTLELIRNLSKKEAELIAKIADAALSNSNNTKYYVVDDREFLKNEFDINFMDIVLLEEIGIIKKGISLTINTSTNPIKDYFANGDLCLFYDIQANVPQKSVNIFLLTTAGKEILSILEINPNINVIKNFASKIKSNGISVFYGKVIEKMGTQIRWERYGEL